MPGRSQQGGAVGAAPPIAAAAAETIPGALASAVARFGGAPWMAYDGRSMSFAEMGEMTESIARGLLSAGVRPGDRVGLFAGNGFRWLPIEYATVAIGAQFIPINTWFRFRELDHILRESELQTLVWDGSVLGHDTRGLLDELLPELEGSRPAEWRSERYPALERVLGLGDGAWADGVRPFEALLAAGEEVGDAELRERVGEVAADDVALVMYTSGTTGAPKGAMIRHRSIVNHIGTWARHLELGASDRSIMASPLFWSFGCTINALVPLHVGSMIVLEERFEAETFLRDIVEHRCTHLQGVPSQYEMALKHPRSEEFDLSTLRLVQIGGSASAEGLARRLLERAPKAQMISSYGLTEAVGVNTWTDLGDDLEDVMGTVGHAADDNEISIRDPDSPQRECPSGEVGELWIRGENVMVGYLNSPEATAAALFDGWLRTGDLAVADERGYLSIVGRQVDAYKRGGMNVYPAEVEAFLMEQPQVRMAAVVGVPDEELGEVGAAFVVPVERAELRGSELLELCQRSLARYKVPAHLRIVDELPVTPTGKVQKFRLKESWRGGG